METGGKKSQNSTFSSGADVKQVRSSRERIGESHRPKMDSPPQENRGVETMKKEEKKTDLGERDAYVPRKEMEVSYA